MLRVTTHNVNGIRAAARRGIADWLAKRDPDVLCLQEVRANREHITDDVFGGYHISYHEGHQPGRAGVAVLSRTEPTDARVGFGSVEFDQQGRYIEVDLPGVTVGSLYLPKGDVSGEKWDTKILFMTQLATPALAKSAITGGVDRESSYAARMSDHSPVWVDYDV